MVELPLLGELLELLGRELPSAVAPQADGDPMPAEPLLESVAGGPSVGERLELLDLDPTRESICVDEVLLSLQGEEVRGCLLYTSDAADE